MLPVLFRIDLNIQFSADKGMGIYEDFGTFCPAIIRQHSLKRNW
jgi:hypothetical protein